MKKQTKKKTEFEPIMRMSVQLFEQDIDDAILGRKYEERAIYKVKDIKREKLIAYLIGVVIGMAIGSLVMRAIS